MEYVMRLSKLIASSCQELEVADMPRETYYELNHNIYDKAARNFLDLGKQCGRSLCYSFCGAADEIAETMYVERQSYWDNLCKLVLKSLNLL